MITLQAQLNAAAADGVISAEQAEKLVPYLSAELAVASPVIMATEDEEAPRFLRGFHDILISIGIVVAMVGLWGVGSLTAVLMAIVILSEILIRRQRLALPGVVLTGFMIQWIFAFVGWYFDQQSIQITPDSKLTDMLSLTAPFPILLALYYWRYRIPVALAACLISLVGAAVMTIIYMMDKVAGLSVSFDTNPALIIGVVLLGAVALFSLAMIYELRDPQRKTRYSDVAFWLHLATAPLLIYSFISLVLLLKNGEPQLIPDIASPSNAFVILVIVLAMMIIGLLINRRAFVTSGLLSMGWGIWTLLQRSEIGMQNLLFTTPTIVGCFVLVIGIGWVPLRKAVVGLLPAAIQKKLSPV